MKELSQIKRMAKEVPIAQKGFTTGFFILLLLGSITACKKMVVTELPGNQEATELNFYPASDVLNTYTPRGAFTPIYIDHFMAVPKGANLPGFQYSGTTGLPSDYPSSQHIAVVTYVPYNAGVHRVMFADNSNSVLLDTSINQPDKSFNCLYLGDAPTAVNAPSKYKMVIVPEDRSGIAPDQVGIRFIHLGPDAGALRCSRLRADGTLTNAAPASLDFGNYTAYQYFTAQDTVRGLLRFSLDNPANGASIATAVPYNPGRKYAVLISGFLNDQQRQVPAGKKPDSTILYQSITISRNLRATVRRIY